MQMECGGAGMAHLRGHVRLQRVLEDHAVMLGLQNPERGCHLCAKGWRQTFKFQRSWG